MQLLSIPCFISARKKKIQFVIILITYKILKQLNAEFSRYVVNDVRQNEKYIYIFFPNNIYMTIT